MGFSLGTTLQAVQDLASTLIRTTPTGLTFGETMFDPASWHGHQGDNDIFVLTKTGLDFQLFRSHDDITFIHGNDDVARLWRLAQLQVPRKRRRKRVAAPRPRPQVPTAANQVWSYDFVFDHCANGQQLKFLTVTDEFTKEGLAIEVDGRIRSSHVIDALARLVSERCAPKFLRSDNGPEFVSKAMLAWIASQGIGTALIDPGKPWQNGVGESFNGKFRDECLSLEWFRSRAEAKVMIEQWRRHYNEVRPHSSLGYLTPAAFAAKAGAVSGDATGRDAAVFGASAPRPVALPPRRAGYFRSVRTSDDC
jgi:putative transposase